MVDLKGSSEVNDEGVLAAWRAHVVGRVSSRGAVRLTQQEHEHEIVVGRVSSRGAVWLTQQEHEHEQDKEYDEKRSRSRSRDGEFVRS